MSIPVTASEEAFVPACMAEIDGAPSFTFRHATVLDKHQFHRIAVNEGLMQHDEATVRQTIVSELKRLFDSEGLAQNITKLEHYWQANDEYREAMAQHQRNVMQILQDADEGEKPELPPEPELEFPAEDTAAIEDMIAEVRRYSTRVNTMLGDNQWFGVMYPRILLRMFLQSTTLPVEIVRRNGLITADSAEHVIEALVNAASDAGVDARLAESQLLLQAILSYSLSREEEKNSSSPRSGISSPKSSAKQPSSSKAKKSSDPATTDAESGLNSSA